MVRDLRLVATVRNRIVHEDGYDRIERKREFLQACRRAERALQPRLLRRRWLIWLGLGLFAAFAVWALMRGQSPVQIPG